MPLKIKPDLSPPLLDKWFSLNPSGQAEQRKSPCSGVEKESGRPKAVSKGRHVGRRPDPVYLIYKESGDSYRFKGSNEFYKLRKRK